MFMKYGTVFYDGVSCLTHRYNSVSWSYTEEEVKELQEALDKFVNKQKIKELKSSLEYHENKVRELENKLGEE